MLSKKVDELNMKIDEDKKIMLYSDKKFYFGDEKKGNLDVKVIESELGASFLVAELEPVSYEELLQRSFKNAYERNPNYFEEDRVTTFLFWCDDILFDLGNFDWTYNERDNKILYLSHFFYTKMTKYQDVLNEEIFGRSAKVYVNKTSRSVVKKIVDFVKKNEI